MWDGVDRRIFPRAHYPCLITIRKNFPPPQATLTNTEDISVGGVRIIIGKRIELMTEIDLEIDLKDTLPTIILRGTVSWVKEAPPGRKGKPPRYDTGIKFITLKNEYRRRIQHVVEHLLGK